MSTLISTRFIVTHLLIVGILLTFANHVAPAKKEPFHAKVIVDVTSESHKTIIESYLRRSLRELNDVEICYGLDPDVITFGIEVVHMKRETGMHVLSTIIQGFIPPSNLRNPDWALNPMGDKERPCIVYHHLLYSGGTDINSLYTYCEKIIATFDMQTIEAWRLMRRIYRHLDGQANR